MSAPHRRILGSLAVALLLPWSGCARMSDSADDSSVGLNGGFEIMRSELPVNWTVYTPTTIPTGSYELSADTEERREGAQSLRFDVVECAPTGGWHSPGIARELDGTPGTRYRVSLWLRNEGCQYTVQVGGVAPKTGVYETVAASPAADGAWTYIEHEFTMPDAYDRLRFELSIRSPGRLWIDDVRIEPVADALAVEGGKAGR